MDKNSLIIGIVFLLGAGYCLFDLITQGLKSFSITGIILFTLVGIGFIKKSRSR